MHLPAPNQVQPVWNGQSSSSPSHCIAAASNNCSGLEMASKWYEKAIQCLSVSDLDGAHVNASKALQCSPDSPEVCLLNGRVAMMTGNSLAAIHHYTQGTQKPSSPLIRFQAYYSLGLIAREQLRWSDAVEAFKHAAEINPSLNDVLIHLAHAYSNNFQFDEAIKTYCRVLEISPANFCVHSDLGNLYKYIGRMDDAKMCYLKALEINPSFAIGWSNLGCLFTVTNEIWLSIHYFEKATLLDPQYLDAFLNLGNVLKQVGCHERSLAAYHHALSLAPNNSMVVANLASVYYERGQYHLSIEMYRRALEIKPDFPDALCNLANALKVKGNGEEAEQCYLEALKIDPRHADSLNNLANLKRERGLVSQALEMYQKAIEVCPHFAAPHANIANLMQHHKLGSAQAIVDHYRAVIRLQPNSADAHVCMGNSLKDLIGDTTTALSYYDRAIQLNPTSLEAYIQTASTLKERGDVDGAISAYRIAIRIKPDFPDAVCSLAHCLQSICDWSNYDEMIANVIEIVNQQLNNTGPASVGRSAEIPSSVHPHHSMLYPLGNAQRKQIAARHADLCIKRIESVGVRPFTHTPRINKQRIRVGYVSSDFCNHPTSHLMQSIPGMHDRQHFEIFCYALTADDGTNFRSKIKSEAEHFVDISEMTFFDAARLVNEHQIDILVNLNGYTKGAQNEIFAMKPAPVQVMWLGYPNTSGSTFMDYIITDAVASPVDQAEQFSEKMAYMPNSFFIGDHKQMFHHMADKLVVSPPITSTTQTNNTLPAVSTNSSARGLSSG